MARNLSTLWQFIKMSSFLRTNSFWIGVTDFLHERNDSRSGWQFSWGSDSNTLAIDSNFVNNNWHSGQPDNTREIEHCVYLNYGKLVDAPCFYPYKFVCEFDASYYEVAFVDIAPAANSVTQWPCTNFVNSVQSNLKCAETFVHYIFLYFA